MKKVFVVAMVLGCVAILGLGIATFAFFSVDVNPKKMKAAVEEAKKSLTAPIEASENRVLLLSGVAENVEGILRTGDTPSVTDETVQNWSSNHAFARSELPAEDLQKLKSASLVLAPFVSPWIEGGKKAAGAYPHDAKNPLDGSAQVRTQALLDASNAFLTAADLFHFQKKYDVALEIVHANLALGADLMAAHLAVPQAVGAKIVLRTIDWFYRTLAQDTAYAQSPKYATVMGDLDRLKSQPAPVVRMVENEMLFLHDSVAYVVNGKKDDLRKKLPRFFVKIFLDRDYKIGMGRYLQMLEAAKSEKDPQALQKKLKTIASKPFQKMTPVSQSVATDLSERVAPLMLVRAKVTLDQTISALVRHRREKGTYPDRLEEVVSAGYLTEIPVDPLAPLSPPAYQKAGDFYRLESDKAKQVYVEPPVLMQTPLALLDLFSPEELIARVTDLTEDVTLSAFDIEGFTAAQASETMLVENVLFDPLMHDNRQWGFKVGTITAGGLAARLGLVMGDGILAIDSIQPQAFNEAMLLDLLKTRGFFTLIVLRDNQTKLLRVVREGAQTPWASALPVPAAPPTVTPNLPDPALPTAPVLDSVPQAQGVPMPDATAPAASPSTPPPTEPVIAAPPVVTTPQPSPSPAPTATQTANPDSSAPVTQPQAVAPTPTPSPAPTIPPAPEAAVPPATAPLPETLPTTTVPPAPGPL